MKKQGAEGEAEPTVQTLWSLSIRCSKTDKRCSRRQAKEGRNT